MENILLSTDKDGNYFTDRTTSLFQYILQFLRCGKLVLTKGFNELELLQVEADCYQMEELISAIEDHKRVTEIKEGDGNVALFIFSHSMYINDNFCSVYKKTQNKQTDFEKVHCGVFCSHTEIRSYLENDYWILKESKKFKQGAASMFLAMRGIEIDLSRSMSVDVELWVRDASVDFYKWFSWFLASCFKHLLSYFFMIRFVV